LLISAAVFVKLHLIHPEAFGFSLYVK